MEKGEAMTRWRWQHIDRRSGVYLVSFAHFVKIGYSSRIGARLRELETGIPEHLTLHKIIDGATITHERELHRQFKELRLKNEWFQKEFPLLGFLGISKIPAEPEQNRKVPTHKQVAVPTPIFGFADYGDNVLDLNGARPRGVEPLLQD